MRQQYTFARQPRHVYTRLLGRLLSGLLLLLTGLTAQAQKTWIGTTTNWNTASNWSPAGIPTASDNVVIAASAATQPVLTVSAVAGSVEVQSGASLSITSGGKLTLNGSRDFGSGQTTAFYTGGTVTNAGQLVIGNTSAVGRYGLINKGSFSNETGGSIAIDRTTSYGLANSATNNSNVTTVFTNLGQIIIGANTTVGVIGLANSARFDNNPGGVISIDRSSDYGLQNYGTFNNAAQISIGATAEVGLVGFYNLASLNNNPGGIITIDRTSYYGLWNLGTVTNAASITIGSIAQAAYWGLYNQTTFNNNPGGVIAIDRTTNLALKNEDNRFFYGDATDNINPLPNLPPQLFGPGIDTYAEFTNKGRIIIGAIAQFGLNGIRNIGNFYNTGCDAYIDSYGNVSHWVILRANRENEAHNYTQFSNSGFIIERAPCCSGLITYNSGVIRNLNGGNFDIQPNSTYDIFGNVGLLTTTPGGPSVSPIVTVNSSLTISQGQTTTLTASEAVSYRWSTGQTTASISVSTAGTYSVTGTVGDCSGTTSVVVSERTEAPSVSINPSSATLSCSSPTASLTANGTGTFRWSTGSTASQISVSTAGIYSVTLTSSDNRTATASVTVNAAPTNPSPTLVSSGTLTCAQTSVTLTASGGGTYRFSNGAAQLNGGNTARVTTAGLYSVTVTGTNGCSAVASTPVQSNTAAVTLSTPTVSTATLGQAFSQPFTATGGTSPYSYSVASGSLPAGLSLATTGVLSGTPTQSGSFTLTVRGRDANGCSDLSDPYRLTVSASASVIRYVKAGGAGDRSGGSWADASDDLQSQIDFAGAQQVWVAQGTYKPGGTANTDRTLSFAMRNGVSILGGFAASGAPTLAQRNPGSFTTVLSGDIGTIGSNSDNSLHVINNGGLNATAMLDGFVIRDGNSDSNYASGMNNYSSSPIVTNCSFQNNVGYYGAGMSNIVNSNPTVTNCSFQNNSSTAYGGGMYNDESSPVLTNCSFQGNSAYQGGGMSNNGSSGRPSLTNCSFQNNSATQGGAIINYFNTVSLTNCVVFGNGGDNTIPSGFGSITASYCLFETSVTGYIDGGNNLTTSVSPFMSPTDARLNGCSPAINAGNNAAYTANGGPTTDLAGNPRFFNNGTGTPDRIDMGAYEYQAAPTAITVTAPSVSTTTVGVAFSQNFTATGGTSPYSYSLASGSLPAGLSLATTGVLSGTPTQTGSLTLTVLGRDANGCSGISAAYVLTVSEPASVMLTGLAATPNTVCAGSPVTFTATVGNVTGSYSYTITNGLSSFLTGSASGTTFIQSLIATGSGEQSFTLTVSANGRSATSVAPVTVNALPTAGLVNNGPLTCAQTSVTLTASGGTAYTFTGPGGAVLPGSGNSRVVSSPGNYSVTVANASGCANTASTTVTSTTATVSITSPAVSTATVGIPFSQAFIASGGVSPYSFGVGSGNLPASLSLSTTGVLSGTPTQPDTYTMLVQASDVNGCTGSGTTYSLTVNPPPVITRLTVLSRDPDNGQLNTNTLKPYLQLQNDGDSPIPYGELTVRYWLTVENPVPLRFDINYAQMGNDKVQLTYVPISPARQGATGYIEFGFDASAGSLGAGSTAVIQDLINKQDYSQFFQGDDYSYANTGNFVANPRITAYRNGVLVYGQEPGPVTGGGPSALSLTASASPTTLLTTGTTQLQALVMGGTAPFTYSYSGPGTISGSGSTVTVSGLMAGVQTFTVTVTDATAPMNQTVTATVSVTVTAPPANQPPVASPNTNQTATVGGAFTYAANAFADDTPNSLTYTASINPANGLSFNPATRVIQGTPMNTGVSSVTITATDPGGLSASTIFTITVLPHPVGTPTTLTVLSRDPDNGQINTNTLKPYLQLQNDGDSPIPYGELTVRYWLTVENPVPLRFDINYAQMGNDKVQLTYVPISPARQGATGYIEFGFDASAGSLGAGSTAVIQDLINKQDYSQFFQGDDYSYANTGNFVANPRITAYRNGVLVYGQEPGPVTGGGPSALSLTASASPTTLLTTGTTQLQALVMGGTAPFTYSYSGPGTISGSGSTVTVSGLMAGVQTFTVTVTDATAPMNQTVTATVSVTVTAPPANQPPVASPNTNQTATVGGAFTYAANAFADDTPNSLTYTASINPANGLSFNPATRVIQGTPMNTGVSSVTITATDPGGLSASTIFTITVLPHPVGTPTTLTVLSRDPDNGQINTNTLKPYLQLQNDGDSPIPYGELTVRYWLTVENPVPLRFDINYAQMGNDKVQLTYVPISPARQGATGYIEFGFDASAGSLGAGSTAVIQDLINKQDYSQFFQGDDYSYANTGNFVANPRITAYRNGVLVYGQEPDPVTGGGPSALSLTASASPTTLLTTGTTQLQALVMGGTAPFTYSYSGPGTISGSGSTVTVSGLMAGVQTFTVTVTDATAPMNQTVTATVSVTVTAPPANQPPVASPNTNQTATVGLNFTYTVNAFGDETPASLTYTASISPANGLTFDAATRLISGIPASTGVSSVTVTATDPSGLSASTTFTITVESKPVVVPATLTVYSRDPDNGQLNTNTLKPYLQLQNDGTTAIPYGQLTVRYWLTVENPAPLRYEINYAQLGSDKVHLSYVAQPRQQVSGYIEFSFDASAGNLGAMSNSGPIQDLINKQDYSYFYQGDDYSYINNGNFVPNPRITAYLNGQLIYGTEPPSGARQGAEPLVEPLQVRVLGNPVVDNQIAVAVSGIQGTQVRYVLTDVGGRLVDERQTVPTGGMDRQTLRLVGHPAGVYLLRVTTATQAQTVKVLKTE